MLGRYSEKLCFLFHFIIFLFFMALEFNSSFYDHSLLSMKEILQGMSGLRHLGIKNNLTKKE